ncbi:response regulator transcription factor [Candidatus Falkowbacteria bacterium]|nr:response regulator transcription factor [Candidatus Falkowbacteria bacterium]
MRILLIEDQASIGKLVKDGLENEGFAVDWLEDGESAQLRIELNHEDYDLVLLDLMLPKRDGLTVCKNIREQNIHTPILMLTAKDSQEDIITGLNYGADDYLVKPFSFEVLLARIRAILRRPTAVLPTEMRAKDVKLDAGAKKAFRNGQEVKLTLKEFSLLEYMMRHPNQVLTRDQILSNVWDFAFDSFSNVVDVHITNLRKKINDHGQLVETVHGVGYRLNA